MRNILWQVASTPPPSKKKKPRKENKRNPINEADFNLMKTKNNYKLTYFLVIYKCLSEFVIKPISISFSINQRV